MKILNIKNNEAMAEKVYETFFSHGETVNRNFFKSDTALIFVAEENEDLVGMVYGYVLERPDTVKKQLFLYNIEVVEGSRRKGIGSELLKAFLASVDGATIKNTFLIVDQTNESAIAFYQSLGGKLKHMEDDYSILMIWED